MPWYRIYDKIADFRCELQGITTQQAARLAIENICNNYPPPYYIMVSGGIDSQAMLYAWHQYAEDFKATCVLYNTDLNEHDIENIKIFSKLHNIDIHYKDFDVLKFYEKEHWEVAKRFGCLSPQLTVHIGMTLDLPGTVVYSGNFIQRSNNPYRTANHCLTRYSEFRPCVPFFFLSQADLAYTQIKYQSSRNLLSLNYLDRVKMYQEEGFPVIGQKEKFTGFEKIKDHYENNLKHLVTNKHKLLYCMQNQSRKVYDILLRHPLKKITEDTVFKTIINDL